MKPATVVTAVVFIVVGAAVGLFMEAQHWIHFLPAPPTPGTEVHPFQVPGDPPVTVGDGSLHTHSKSAWLTNRPGDTTIVPVTDSSNGVGAFYADSDCKFPKGGNTVNASAFLWTDEDNIYDLSPSGSVSNWQVVVKHENGYYVSISVNANNQLQFVASSGSSFDVAKNDDQK